MGRDVAEISAAARATFDEAGRILGYDLADLCFTGPDDRLNATDVSQPAIFVTSVAIWRALQENESYAALVKADATAGLSLGEYTALWLAGAIEFADALRLVQQRGRFMQDAAEARAGSMVSVLGLDEEKLNQAIEAARGGDILAAANFNSPGQTVISGDKAACERSLQAIENVGGRGIALKVAGAFHSPLMEPAAEKLESVLAATAVKSPEIPVVSNVTADYHQSPDSIRSLLRTQVAKPIRWSASIEKLIRDGFDRFVEVGPGRVLTGLMRNIDRGVTAINVSSVKTMEKLGA